jgi:hypothetical protein
MATQFVERDLMIVEIRQHRNLHVATQANHFFYRLSFECDN